MSVLGHIVTVLFILHFDSVLSFGAQPSTSRNVSHRRFTYIYRQDQRLHAFSSDSNENYLSEDDTDELSDEELEASVGKWDEKIARFNTIQLTGRVGNTPEARYFDDGKVVVNLSLASRRKYHGMERKLNNIEMGEEETDWYGLEIWVR
jgi:Single-strand binding protein family